MGMVNNIDDATLTVSSTAITLTSGSPTLEACRAAGAKHAIIYVVSGAGGMYVSEDGNDAASGDAIAYPGDILEYTDGVSQISILERLSFLRVTNDVALSIKYYD